MTPQLHNLHRPDIHIVPLVQQTQVLPDLDLLPRTVNSRHLETPMRILDTRPEAGVVRTELAVGGMNCSSCARHVETALVTLGDISADVDIVSATAYVTHPASIPVADLVDAIEDAGYAVLGTGLAATG